MKTLTEEGLVKILKAQGFATKRDLNKLKKELITTISNVAVTSPTLDMFTDLALN